LATMAYVFCALIMYVFWWHKPFGVEHVTIISEVTRENLHFGSKWRRTPDIDSSSDGVADLLFNLVDEIDIQGAIFYGVATAFSAIHLAAWNWEFSSPDVGVLWRSFGLAATAAGPSMILLGLLVVAFDKCVTGHWIYTAAWVPTIILGVVYGISRLGLIVLIIYSFKSMPAGVYETVDWTNYFPFFS
jgi:hypothetical protein